MPKAFGTGELRKVGRTNQELVKSVGGYAGNRDIPAVFKDQHDSLTLVANMNGQLCTSITNITCVINSRRQHWTVILGYDDKANAFRITISVTIAMNRC